MDTSGLTCEFNTKEGTDGEECCQSHQNGLIGAAGVISMEDVGSGKIDVSLDQYRRAFGSQQCN